VIGGAAGRRCGGVMRVGGVRRVTEGDRAAGCAGVRRVGGERCGGCGCCGGAEGAAGAAVEGAAGCGGCGGAEGRRCGGLDVDCLTDALWARLALIY